MLYNKKKPSCKLEEQLFQSVFENTPDKIRKLNLIDLSNKDAFTFTLKREHLYNYDKYQNPEGLNLLEWLENYEKEAKVSTAGIRGPQNILFPQDPRFPINLIGITITTLAKALVLKNKGIKNPIKIVAREVRYNSDLYLEAIARIQAAYGIKTLVPSEKKTIPIWLTSFIIFKLGLTGGEYITSSHGIAIKNATKDLNSMGGQFLPEESLEFVNKIREIFEQTEKNGQYKIEFANANDPLIDEQTLTDINDGIDLYVEYLKISTARKMNIKLIKEMKNKIIIENVGGCAYRTMDKILKKLDIDKNFDWFNKEEDPFYHSIGKTDVDLKENKFFYDYSVDVSYFVINEKGQKIFPVLESLNYNNKLKNYPINTIVLITDPDNDRLTIVQVESSKNILNLKKLGIEYINLSNGRILTIYSANQSFLMLMNKQDDERCSWLDFAPFIIKSSVSSSAWDEWAKKKNINVVNVPVGFKEIANVLNKVEEKIRTTHQKDIYVTDIFGQDINLGKKPRLFFAGEESGGMIVGSHIMIKSITGIESLSMREKSATCAMILASVLAAKLEKENKSLSEYFAQILDENTIHERFDTRADISYYNESEPDIEKLKEEKKDGEKKRTKNDLFYLSLALGIEFKIITLEQAKKILNDAFNKLFTGINFSDIEFIKFVGDGTYLKFKDKFVEIRPSGTDAKTRAYAAGKNKDELEKYTQIMGNYSGKRNDLYKKLIPKQFYKSTKEKALCLYTEFENKK